ncbi:MAG: SDR family oxidoreductase, partial [Thermoanaerobaculia bacterium]|nr:SDR family oxidoreductase [Thermoanaerobaculia bacterium]
GRRALITGAARGRGEARARRFTAEGAVVVRNDLDAEAARATAAKIGGGAQGIGGDVSDPSAVRAMFAALEPPLDILVNNAGIGSQDPEVTAERVARALRQAEEVAAGGPVETHLDATVGLSDEDWRQMLAVHLDGTFYCSREALKIMNEQGSGCIVNMGSIMGTAGGAGFPHYCAAKAGILGLTRSLAREVVTRNIRVNAIAPGYIETELLADLADMKPLIAAQTPMGRLGEPDDVAWAAVYLASDEARYVTDQVLSPNGGWHMSQ